MEHLDRLPFQPTELIESGHGIQAFWRFSPNWLFPTVEDREQGRRAAMAWRDTVQGAFAPYKVDSTFDFARVMRVPGSVNVKSPVNPVAVKLLSSDGPIYDPETFIQWMNESSEPAAESTGMGSAVGSAGGSLALRPDAEPPELKLDTLIKMDPRFAVTWRRERADLEDQSQSGYDLAIANALVAAGWTDQEIVDALICHRRIHGQQEKLRLEYLRVTISKARKPSPDWPNQRRGQSNRRQGKREDPDAKRGPSAFADADGIPDRWTCTPLADALRALRDASSELLLAKDPISGNVERIYTATRSGIWQNADDKFRVLLRDAVLNRASEAVLARRSDEISDADYKVVTNHALALDRSGYQDDAKRQVGPALALMEKTGTKPAGLLTAFVLDLDRPENGLGAPNGVVDLNTGRLLPPDESRQRFITQCLPDPFIADAPDTPETAELLEHLDSDLRECFLNSLGYALRGNPGRRFYVLVGETGRGKSTVLGIFQNSLGAKQSGGYSGTVPQSVLQAGRNMSANGHSSHVLGLFRTRIAGGADLDTSEPWSRGVLKAFTDGVTQHSPRDVGEKSRIQEVATGTMFLTANKDIYQVLPLYDEAIRDRVVLFEWPDLPPEKRGRDISGPLNIRRARQRLVAELVKRTVAHPLGSLPAKPASHRIAMGEHQHSALSPVERWLVSNIQRGRPGDRLPTNRVWQAMTRDFGLPEDSSEIDGCNRLAMPKLARSVVEGLPETKKMKVGGVSTNGWQGFRLAQVEDDAPHPTCEETGSRPHTKAGSPPCRDCGTSVDNLAKWSLQDRLCEECYERARLSEIDAAYSES